jgi:hypothetical protein
MTAGAIGTEHVDDAGTPDAPRTAPRREPPRPKKRKITLRTILLFTALGAVTLVFIYPFIWLLSASFKPQGEVFDNKILPETFTFDNYINVWQQAPMLLWLWNTVFVTVLAAVAVTISSALVAWGFSYFRFRGRNFLFGVVLSDSEARPVTVAMYNFIGVEQTLWGPLTAGAIVAMLADDPWRVRIQEGRGEEFAARMADALTTFAAGFAPRPVTYRTIDFRTNEFRGLEGGAEFEPEEANPMIGYRGALRYVREPDLLQLELDAVSQVYDAGHSNLHVMLPFVRSARELAVRREIVARSGLLDRAGFELWVMAEVPSVLFNLERYAELGVVGISIGSNDLTQLLLGADRDSEVVTEVFDERDPAWGVDEIRRERDGHTENEPPIAMPVLPVR